MGVCIGAAGGSLGRRSLYRASSIGYLANIFNGQFGLAVRIGALRRSAPTECPRAPVLLAAELPIVVVEIGLAAIFSFTLVAPLGVPWWVPLVAFAAVSAVFVGMQRVARNRLDGNLEGYRRAARDEGKRQDRRPGLPRGGAPDRAELAAAQLERRRCLGVRLDRAADRARGGRAAAGRPQPGRATAVLILGTDGVAASAAAGALLTATAAAGALCFASWALVDRFWGRPLPAPMPVPALSAPTA